MLRGLLQRCLQRGAHAPPGAPDLRHRCRSLVDGTPQRAPRGALRVAQPCEVGPRREGSRGSPTVEGVELLESEGAVPGQPGHEATETRDRSRPARPGVPPGAEVAEGVLGLTRRPSSTPLGALPLDPRP